MKVVLDTSALIYLHDFYHFEKIVSVPEVVEEVKDRVSKFKLASMKLKLLEPKKNSIDKIKRTAEKTGDIEKLSKTDIKVLATALETGYTIISDDFNIQNVAEKLKLKYISTFSPRIKELIVWKKYCKECKKIFFVKRTFCPMCGSKLKKISFVKRKV